jgi:hypothetical protein
LISTISIIKLGIKAAVSAMARRLADVILKTWLILSMITGDDMKSHRSWQWLGCTMVGVAVTAVLMSGLREVPALTELRTGYPMWDGGVCLCTS